MHLFEHPPVDSAAQHRRMLETPIPKLVTVLAVPTTISQLVTVIYNTADTYFVSHIGTSASAAVGIVFSLMSIIQAFGYGISMGANSLISRRLGAKRDGEAFTYASSALFTALVLGVLLMAAGLLTLDPLMRLLGSTETMLPYARDYARYILLGAPMMCVSFSLNGILRAEGEATLSMWGLCAGGILNVVLDPIFIFVLGMGTAGAAIATVIGQTVSLLLLLSAFFRGRSIVKLSPRYISFHIGTYLEIVKLGFPTICRQGMASVASALLNNQAAVYGDAAVAAVTIANKVYLLVRNIIIGIGQGFQPVAGYNYGAGNKKRVRESVVFVCTLGTAVCVLSAVVLFFFAPAVIAFFRDDPEVVEIGTHALYYACAVMPFMAYSTFVNQMYQCLGFSVRAPFLACCRQGVFFVPLILILPRFLGLSGVEMTQPAADLVTFLICIPFQIVFFKTVLKKKAAS